MLDRIRNLTDKQRALLIGAGLSAALWLYLVLVFWPQRQELTAAAAQYAVEKQQLRVVEAFALQHPDADAFLQDLSQRQGITDTLLPNDNDVAGYLLQVERAAQAAGIKLLQVKPGASANKTGYREVPLEVTVQGTFFQIIGFIKKLEDSNRFSAVQSVSMKAHDGIIDSRLAIAVYAYGVLPAKGK